MIDYNRLVMVINNLMRFFYKLDVLWNNSCYLILSNTSGHELLKYYVLKLSFILNKKENLCIGDQKVFRVYLEECCLDTQLIVRFNFGLDHQFNCLNQLTFSIMGPSLGYADDRV